MTVHPPLSRGIAALVALLVWTTGPEAQAPPRPQLYAVHDVRLARGGDEAPHVTLILREGRVQSVQDADAPIPPGARVVEGKGQLALPAFLDTYSRKGLKTPVPKADQDVPVDVKSDVRIDMRLANRKGIEPAFRAVDELSIADDQGKAWRESGFGAALVAPGSQLLAGTSVLATTREAATRDVVVRPAVFAHAAFDASGPGYPSTLMGYIAQLRQFFLDAGRQVDLTQRYESGRSSIRPAYDDELEAGASLLRGDERLVCEAQTARDVNRWIRLADQFGLHIAISGGRDAWKVADELAQRGIPVFLTLDWGDEVPDPLAKEKEKEKAKEKGEEKPGEEAAAGEETPPGEAPASDAPQEPAAPASPAAPDATPPAGAGAQAAPGEAAEKEEEPEHPWTYEQPLAVRQERRRLWEEGRDSTLRLAEAGVSFAFGTGGDAPAELLKRVRKLVELGLPADAAYRALTSEAAALLGVGQRLGSLEPGHDATLVLWTADPLTDAKAKPAWIFVDGYPTQLEVAGDEEVGNEGPAEGVDLSGTWTTHAEMMGQDIEGRMELTMAADGTLTGTLHQKNPRDQSDMEIALEGRVGGHKVLIESTIEMGRGKAQVRTVATLQEDGSLSGDSSLRTPRSEQPVKRPWKAERVPERTQGGGAR